MNGRRYDITNHHDKVNTKIHLKIPKGHSEVVNRRRIDNTMTKTKNDKRTNNDFQYTTQKMKEGAT